MQAMPTQQPRHGLPVNRSVRLGGAKPARFRCAAICAKLWPVWRSPSIYAKRSGYVDSWSYRATGRRRRCALVAPSPLQRHIDLFAVFVDIDCHALDQHAHDLLSILSGRFRCLPQGWHISSQAQDRLEFTRRQLRGALTAESRILLLQVLFVTERLFPPPLQLSGHQTIFRFLCS